jgi:hypothetical protein
MTNTQILILVPTDNERENAERLCLELLDLDLPADILFLDDNSPDETVEGHTVRDFLDAAFSYADMDWQNYVEIDPRYIRLNEVNSLVADSTKARKMLGWKSKVDFEMLVKLMVDSDMEQAHLKPNGEGLRALAKVQTRHGAPLSPGSQL